MNNKKIYIKKDVIFGLLDYCKSLHPVEGILLLQGTHSSILGTAHSHPNGVNEPSDTDLLNFFGLIGIIVTPPFVNEKDIKVYSSEGNTIKFTLYE